MRYMMFSGPLSLPTRSRTRSPSQCANCAGLLDEAQPEQGVHRERGVAHPGVAVVPVALAADLLGQGRGRRGHQAAGRGVGHQLQRDRRALDRLAPPAGVGRPGQPRPPEPRPSRRRAPGSRRRGSRAAARPRPTPARRRGSRPPPGRATRAGPRRSTCDAGLPLVAGLAHDVQGQRRSVRGEHGAVLGHLGPVRRGGRSRSGGRCRPRRSSGRGRTAPSGRAGGCRWPSLPPAA